MGLAVGAIGFQAGHSRFDSIKTDMALGFPLAIAPLKPTKASRKCFLRMDEGASYYAEMALPRSWGASHGAGTALPHAAISVPP